MVEAQAPKTCAILLGMGGPNSTADISRYLYNIFCDRSIIRLPGGALLQKPLARLISKLRTRKVRGHYRAIGGRSPLLQWTRTQADQIEAIIRIDYPGFECLIGMRYFDPYIDDTIRQAYQKGFRRICFLPMVPQYSRATNGSAFAVARKTCAKYNDLEAVYVNDYHDNDQYVALLNRYISKNIKAGDTLLFSAHSLPRKFVEEGDPYVDQTRLTAKLAAGKREYFLSFQSRTGPVKWVGPDTIDEVKRLLAERDGDIFIVPISFVCDHIETMYELDIELKGLVEAADRERLRRMPMFNDDSEFAGLLAGLILEKVSGDG